VKATAKKEYTEAEKKRKTLLAEVARLDKQIADKCDQLTLIYAFLLCKNSTIY
jgi:hypothetical protein